MNGYTQIELAKRCSISQAALSGYETGRFEPDFETLGVMADLFGVSTDYLLGRTDTEPTQAAVSNAPDDDLMELREQLRRKPGMRTLFSAAKNATEEDLLRAVKIIEALKGASDD